MTPGAPRRGALGPVRFHQAEALEKAQRGGPAGSRPLANRAGGSMRQRLVAPLGLAIALALLPVREPTLMAQGVSTGQPTRGGTGAKPYSPPRTEDGRPDLHGTWSFAFITPLER